MTANLCPVCRRPPLRGADFEADGFLAANHCDADSYDRAAGEECEHVGRMHAEAERDAALDAALDALRRVGCLRYTSEFPAPCKPEDEDTCSRCRGLWAGTPPVPTPVAYQSGSNGFQGAPAPVSRDAVLEEAVRAIEAEASGWRDSRILNAMSLAIEAVRLLKTKEPA
jgi:hypothetical protein